MKGLFKSFKQVSSMCLFWCLSASSGASDFRVSGALKESNADQTNFIFTIDDCSSVSSVNVSVGSFSDKLDISEFRQVGLNSSACETLIQSDSGLISPSAEIFFVDNSSGFHNENFYYEKNLPNLAFQEVSISREGGQQQLVVHAEASDDVDLSYVGFSVSGIRASELRAAGGVVEIANKTAFASTNGYSRVYPIDEGQTQYALTVPIETDLSPEAIANDGIVLVNLIAVDASGNQANASEIAFTGDSVSEDVNGLVVDQQEIVFTSLLESIQLIPRVDYQFRGLTPLPGAGTGVRYSSSNEEVVQVTLDGIVYPVSENVSDQPVIITVSYPGVDDVLIPVDVNFQYHPVSLQIDNVDSSGFYNIDHLNEYLGPPSVSVVFNNGSTGAITSLINLDYSLQGDGGVLRLGQEGKILARSIISPDSPASLTVQLASDSSINVTVPVVAHDAPPKISLKMPKSATLGQEAIIKAVVSDDVAVSEVNFLLNGTPIGTRTSPPYEVSLTLPPELSENQKLLIQASARDSAGQSTLTSEVELSTTRKNETPPPQVVIERPVHMQRVIEDTTIQIQAARDLGVEDFVYLEEADSSISYVEFLIDGKKVGTSRYPMFERRIIDPGPPIRYSIFEVWKIDAPIGEISTDETSRSVVANIHGRNGVDRMSEAQLIRVVKNSPAEVFIDSPLNGSDVSAGQNIPVRVRFKDDTLALGTAVSLYVNNQRVSEFYFQDLEQEVVNGMVAREESHTFTHHITEELIGQSLSMFAEVVDSGQRVSRSLPINVTVKEDRPPTVALSNPIQGASYVSGSIVELRANAADDIGVTRVEFFCRWKVHRNRYKATLQLSV